MNGLCGWLGETGTELPPEIALARMADALPRVAGRHRFTAARTDAGLALCSEAATAWAADDAGPWCAIDGDPTWADPALAAVARSHGHGAALVQAWRLRGTGLLEGLRGRFALAVVDRRNGTAMLAVDRAGTRPLAYQAAPGRLVFASTVDAVRGHPSVNAAPSLQALFDYLHLSVIPAPRTAYTGIEKLPPAGYLLVGNGQIRTGCYWSPSYQAGGERSMPVLARQLHDRLHAAVARAVDGAPADRLGTFLSGGLDSSTVLGLASSLVDRPVRSFTIGFDADDFDERVYADLAVRHFKAVHHTASVTPDDTAELLPRIAEAYDEPFGNASAVPTYYCARLAREHGVEVMLAGDGGDEIFAGNARYALQLAFALYDRVPPAARRLFEPALFGLPFGDGIPALRRARGYVRRAREPMPERLESYSYLSPATHSEVFEADFLAAVDPDGPMEALRSLWQRSEAPTLLQRMLRYDWQITLADNDLRKVGRMAELAGITVRYPFLDEEVVEFAAGIPPELLIRRLQLRHFYKQAMKEFLPAEIIAKRKQGFGLPFRVWAGRPGRLRDLVQDTLAAFARRRIVRRDWLDRLLASWDPEEAKRYGQCVWYLVVLELWLSAREQGVRP